MLSSLSFPAAKLRLLGRARHLPPLPGGDTGEGEGGSLGQERLPPSGGSPLLPLGPPQPPGQVQHRAGPQRDRLLILPGECSMFKLVLK